MLNHAALPAAARGDGGRCVCGLAGDGAFGHYPARRDPHIVIVDDANGVGVPISVLLDVPVLLCARDCPRAQAKVLK